MTEPVNTAHFAEQLLPETSHLQPPDATPLVLAAAKLASSFKISAGNLVSGAHCLSALPILQKEQFKAKLEGKMPPYFPQKRGPSEDFNCKLLFDDSIVHAVIKTPGFSDNTIVCRHLTAAYLQLDENGKFVPPATTHEIQRRAGKWTEGWHRLAYTQAPHCHLLHNDGLGAWLVQQASKLQASSNDSAPAVDGTTDCQRFILESAGHSMALTLRRKIKMGVEHYVLTFYDPNTSTNHMRSVAITPEGFSNLTLKNLIPKNIYSFYHRNGGEHSLVYELPSPQQDQQIFNPEAINKAIFELPQPAVRQLKCLEPVDWGSVHVGLINKNLNDKIVDVGMYRYLFASKTALQGDALWRASKEQNAIEVIRWDSLDAVNVEQWLTLELEQLLGAENPDFDGFRSVFEKAMKKLPTDLQQTAWRVFSNKLQSLIKNEPDGYVDDSSALSGFSEPAQLQRFVQNLSAMLPMLETLIPPPDLKLNLPITLAERCFLRLLNGLVSNPEKNQELANQELKGTASLQCRTLIRKVLREDKNLAAQLPELSKMVDLTGFADVVVESRSALIWKKVRAVFGRCLRFGKHIVQPRV